MDLQIFAPLTLRGSDSFTPSSLVIVTDYNNPLASYAILVQHYGSPIFAFAWHFCRFDAGYLPCNGANRQEDIKGTNSISLIIFFRFAQRPSSIENSRGQALESD